MLGTLLLATQLATFQPQAVSQEIHLKKEVKVSVLSRQFRLLKEKSLNEIIIELPDGAVINGNQTGSQLPLHITFDRKYHIYSSTQSYDDEIIEIYSPDPNAFMTVHLQNEIRKYPLPAHFSCLNNELLIVVAQNINDYSWQSANAEYGTVNNNEREVLYALSMIITARLVSPEYRSHSGYDLCDLTHCQSYRGIVSDRRNNSYSCMIDPESCKGRLFFQSRCGGETYGNKIFTLKSSDTVGVRDVLLSNGAPLCVKSTDQWQKKISLNEIGKIVLNNPAEKINYLNYNRNMLTIELATKNQQYIYSPEDFRLKLNRVLGWSFLPSNNYSLTVIDDSAVFKGAGLGHNVGLCQQGALTLARMGYSRYDILKHYFPGIKYINITDTIYDPTDYSYVLFDINTGRNLSSSYDNFLSLEVPPGSIMKLIFTLYLATERPDLWDNFSYECTGKSEAYGKKYKCWDIKGHGINSLATGLPKSCNLFFMALSHEVDQNKFRNFLSRLNQECGINIKYVQWKDDNEFGEFIAGLDFRSRIKIGDLVKLVMLVGSSQNSDMLINKFRRTIPVSCHEALLGYLRQTFYIGTAASDNKMTRIKYPLSLWGKTGTVVFGTNYSASFGLFIGGMNDKGIVSLIRYGTGHDAAGRSLKILDK